MSKEANRAVFDGMILPPGTKVGGRITILDVLGNGGFGITYKAKHDAYGEVALKEFMPKSMIYGRRNNNLSVLQDKRDLFETCKRQFLRETRILQSLEHPNIVKVLDNLEENGTAYYVMELLDGEDLGTYIRKRGAPMDPREACELLLPVMRAVEYLHSYEQRVLHRDISPDNILLCRTLEGVKPYLIDFGAAFSAQKDFTQTFPRVKKNGYSPIEQTYDGTYQGTWSDVYSMSATFYYAVTRTKPVPASERGVGSNDVMKLPSSINPVVSRELEKVLMRGMALDHRERIQQISELREGICSAVGYEQRRVRPEPPPDSEYLPPPSEPPISSVVSDSVPRSIPSIVSPTDGNMDADRAKGDVRSPIALALDWIICWAMPATIVSMLVSPLVGIPAGAALSIAVNGLLASGGGTMGQRLMNCSTRVSGVPAGLLYSLLRHIPPLAIVDEIAAMRSGKHFIEALVCGKEAAAADTLPDMICQLRCVAGYLQGKVYSLDQSLLIGREADADVMYPKEMRTVSGHHCSLYRDGEGWHVVDMRSRNGTWLNGHQLQHHIASQPLHSGDRIKVANISIFVFEQIGDAYSMTGGKR